VKQHYSEADLLETYYAQPGASMPVMMHLADCGDCAARYERLEKKIRGLAAHECSNAHDKPETFWARQRISIMRKVDARRERSFSIARVAAAAALVLTLTGVIAFRVTETPSRQVVATQTAQVTPLDDATTGALEESPWQSEELSDYQSMVAWESWVESSGDQSL
jgi:predicted anti-sigma-YlaC factor YlaD